MRCVVLTNHRARCILLVKFLRDQQLLSLGQRQGSASWGCWWDDVQRCCQRWLMSIWWSDEKKWSDHNVTVWSHRHKVRNTVRRNRIMYVGAKYRNFWCELGVITQKQMKQKKYLSVLFGQRVTISQQCDGVVKTARWTPAYSPGHSHHFWALSNLSYLTPCLKLVYNFTHIEGNSTQK